MEKEELKRLFEICKEHQVYIISDEIHQDLVFGEHKHIPSLSVGDYDKIMVSIVAASKTFNIAGAQILWSLFRMKNFRKMGYLCKRKPGAGRKCIWIRGS